MVVQQGGPGDAFYVVLEGQLVALLDASGDTRPWSGGDGGMDVDGVGNAVPRSFGFEVAQYSRGGYFGEVALLTGEPRKATVKNASGVHAAAVMKCESYVFERNVLSIPGVREQLEVVMAGIKAQNVIRLQVRLTAA